ncbi:unnamed protein product [Rhizoctonia solani]|uniref:Uncharacterized protein n=1 Tax=Rhizoctonia solani TaxID=456999 RepID=A0A8H3APS0_9AGAM|nr:unnamed protein product [Rhizoctonia solani]
MSFRMYMPADHRAQRTADGSITLIVSNAHVMPPLPYELSGLIVSNAHVMPPLPYELSGLVAHDVWDHRTQTIKMLCARFSKPLYERIWFITAMIATLALPLPLYRLVFDAVFDENRANQTFYAARAAGFGIFLGVIFVFWAPLAFWKWEWPVCGDSFGSGTVKTGQMPMAGSSLTARVLEVGVARMRRQLREWDGQDRSNANGRFVPEWKVEMPGIFSINGRVTISTPPSVAPSSFHAGAYLPPYIHAPAYAPPATQGPMPGTLAYNGGAPVYGYSGPDRDEKSGFQDVNLKV